MIIPKGIFDPLRNRGHINIGLSRDTTEFSGDGFKLHWNRIGLQCKWNYTITPQIGQ